MLRMKLRLLPILLTVALSAAILFGGLFIYRSVAMENPLAHLTDNMTGVQQAKPDIQSDKVTVNLQLASGVSLRELYAALYEKSVPVIGKRELQLNVSSDSSPELDKWWSDRLFDVAEAMETKRYAQIPASLQQHAPELAGLSVATEIDDRNVYIHLSANGHDKYVVLPRVPAKMGVWPNE